MSEWQSVEHALKYLQKADSIPHRAEGEAVLLEEIPENARFVWDLGAGDGRLLQLVLLKARQAFGRAVDFSPAMIEQLQKRFANHPNVETVHHDLAQPFSRWPTPDVVVSSFAIHHLDNERKFKLYQAVFEALEPGGVFCNLEHVSSLDDEVHKKFLDAMGMTKEDEDPSNRLEDVETQLFWLREIGFVHVDCFWKWRELALLIGWKPSALWPA